MKYHELIEVLQTVQYKNWSFNAHQLSNLGAVLVRMLYVTEDSDTGLKTEVGRQWFIHERELVSWDKEDFKLYLHEQFEEQILHEANEFFTMAGEKAWHPHGKRKSNCIRSGSGNQSDKL